MRAIPGGGVGVLAISSGSVLTGSRVRPPAVMVRAMPSTQVLTHGQVKYAWSSSVIAVSRSGAPGVLLVPLLYGVVPPMGMLST